MYFIKRVCIGVCVISMLFACKGENSTGSSIASSEIPFTKEGELTLIKSDGKIIRKIDIEFAEDDYERETGLMHRSSMANHQGMLFIQDIEQIQNFYMKNTLIPLDLVYINSKKEIVSFAENAKPLDHTSLSSQVPAKYVLEINGGLAEEWVLEIGDKVEWIKN